MRAGELAMTESRAARTEQRDLRKKHCFGNANVGVRGYQVFLSLMDVGPAFEQLRRKARGQLRRQSLGPLPAVRSFSGKGFTARDVVRILSQQRSEEHTSELQSRG